MPKRLLILPTLTKTLAAGTTLPAVADVTGQTITPSNYVGFPPAGTDAMTYLLVGKAQVQQSQEVVLVDLLTRPWPVLQRSVNGSPLAAHDATHGVQTVVPPDGLKGLVGFYLDGALVANGSAADFDAAKFDVTDNGDGTVSISLAPSATPIVGNDTIWQALGDLAAATGPNAAVRVPVGTDGQILTADSGQAAGVNWVTPAAGAAFGTITAAINLGDAAVDGASGDVADADHQHAFPAPGAGYPVDVAAAEADGAATTPARSDHVHAHGTGYLPDAHHARSHDHATAGDGTALVPVSLDVSAGPVKLSGDISPTQLTASVNDYAPTGLATATVLRLSSDASRTITGLTGGARGRLLVLQNVGTQNIVLAAESASSSAANRFTLDTSLTLTGSTCALLQYDSTGLGAGTGRWRLIALGKAAVGGSGNVATDTIWAVKGDLAAATGAGTATRVGAGSNSQLLIADSTQIPGMRWGVATQANTHGSPDTDTATSALHHTLGTGANQAAAGDHSHLLSALTSLGQSAQVLKLPVRVSTTVAGTLATSFENGDTVDGVTLATNDRILIKNQASGAENGIYTVNASGAPTRATDADAANELPQGFLVYVRAGSTNADTVWKHTTSAAITLNTTPLTFAQLAGTGSMSSFTLAGDGGTPQTITDTNTLTVAGGSGLVSAAGATDTVTLDLDINSLAADASPDGAADYVATWDASAGAHKKVLLDDLPGGGGGSGLYSAYLQYEDQKTSGTDGGTFTSGAYRTHDLNIEVADTAGIGSVASNQVTVTGGGTFDAEGWGIHFAGGRGAIRLRDITNGVTLLSGSGDYTPGRQTFAGPITLSGTVVLEIQMICETTQSTNGFGVASGGFVTTAPAHELYATLILRKRA